MGSATVKKASMSPPNGSNDEHKEQAAEEANNSPLRRLACDICRDRKVRCDRQDPTCGRCAKVGKICRYSSRAKPTPSKMDLSRFLMTLSNRLKQAEAQLAFSPPAPLMQSPQPFAIPWEDFDMGLEVPPASTPDRSPRTVSPMQMPHPSAPGLNNMGLFPDKITAQPNLSEWSNLVAGDASDFQFDYFSVPISTDLMLAQSLPEGNPNFDFDSTMFDMSSSSTSQAEPMVTPSLLQGLYDRFFEVFHPIMPIINRSRFQTEISQPSPSIEVQVLSYAIGALGAFSVPELRCYIDKCYDQARNLLDICERQESGGSLTNINTLQASVLLTLYEFKRPNFARAWMTLGRAIRLAKIMGLDRPDDNSGAATQWGLRAQSLPSSSPADLEEKRRTFWLLYIFDAFASIRTNSSSAFDKSISVPLPNSSEFPESSKTSESMPSLQQIFDLPEKTPLSSFASTSIMISLYQRCFDHIRSSSHESSHAFWETHYRIDKAISHCRNSLLIQHVNGHSSDDPLSLALRMNLDTVEISLHEAALAKVQKDDLPSGLTTDAKAKCISAAKDIVEAVQLGQKLTGTKLEAFRQLDQFLIWPITMAIQVCFRMLYSGDEDVATYIHSLRILSSSMKGLIDPEHIAPGLLEKADARVSEAERSTKKRRVRED